MPDATEGDRSPYRIVVDESSFDFRGIPEGELADLLEDFSDELEILLRERDVATSPWWSDVECSDGLELWQFLYEGRDTDVSPDTRRRAALHLDRCRTWDDELDGVPDEVAVDGRPLQMALSVGYSLRNYLRGHATACLAFPAISRTRWLAVT